jgi:probable phosphoglycerate mutase
MWIRKIRRDNQEHEQLMHTTNPKPTRLLLIRHGESTSNHQQVISGWSTDVVLTERGRRQALRTAETLRCIERIDALYASPLPRAWETATIIGDVIGLEPMPLPDLREINVGSAVGSPLVDLTSLYPQLQSQLDEDGLNVPWPDGESHAQLRERAMRAVETMVTEHPGQTVAAVAHGGPLGWIVTTLSGDHVDKFRERRHNNCAISELLVRPDADGLAAELVRFNDCVHLGEV